jgi:hypothetical protein
MSADPISHVRVLAQTDPLPNRAKNFTEDLVTAKAMVHDLEHLLKRMDDTVEAIKADTGLEMTYTLGPVGDSAASTRRDLAKKKPTAFALPRREAT